MKFSCRHQNWLASLVFALPLTAAMAEESAPAEESNLRIVPLVTSTPLAGTGVGVATSYLYRVDEDSAKSQLQVGGQHSNTDSTSLFLTNNAFSRGNKLISNSAVLAARTNSEIDDEELGDTRYRVDSFAMTQKLLFRLSETFYAGGGVFYKKTEHSPNNEAGREFLLRNGIVDQDNGGFAASVSWDSRENKYFPHDSYWVDIDVAAAPEWLGADKDYGRVTINARYYGSALREADVWAHQLYAQYSSKYTPDGDLPTLSGKGLLRGFPGGQFRARNLTGAQTEYRYVLEDTAFKITAFAGVAKLNGGSNNTGSGERDDDGTYWAGGVGLRYAIQRRTGVDLRLDVVTNSENEQSLYLTLNQAF